MKVFLSSTYKDLIDYRKIAINYLTGIMGHISSATGELVAMEFFDASENSSKTECLRMLKSCDLVIGIYGDRYGTVDASTGLSLTELEFDFAQEHDIPILRFVKRSVDREKEQNRFIYEKVYSENALCANFDNETDFADRLDGSLKKYLGSFDGYSVDSLWEAVSSIYDQIKNRMNADCSIPELQMLPYERGQEDLAIENIIYGAKCISKIHDELINQAAASETGLISGYSELIYLGLKNWPTSILLSATFLKLGRMQNRLLFEPWSEKLRLEAIAVRQEYLNIIADSQYVD